MCVTMSAFQTIFFNQSVGSILSHRIWRKIHCLVYTHSLATVVGKRMDVLQGGLQLHPWDLWLCCCIKQKGLCMVAMLRIWVWGDDHELCRLALCNYKNSSKWKKVTGDRVVEGHEPRGAGSLLSARQGKKGILPWASWKNVTFLTPWFYPSTDFELLTFRL